jgi:hypothetical protein
VSDTTANVSVITGLLLRQSPVLPASPTLGFDIDIS